MKARAKKVRIKPNQIIIDPSTVERKEAHKKNHIPELWEDFQRTFFYPIIPKHQKQPESK